MLATLRQGAIPYIPFKMNSVPQSGYMTLSVSPSLRSIEQLILDLQMPDALAGSDQAIECLFEHSEFRSAGRKLFQVAVEADLPPSSYTPSINSASGSKRHGQETAYETATLRGKAKDRGVSTSPDT